MMVSVIIPSAGSGKRFGELKQFKLLDGKPLLFITIKPFLEINEVAEVIIVVPIDKISFVEKYKKELHNGKKIRVTQGGLERHASIRNGLKIINEKTGLICIHDAARPFISKKLILDCFKKCEEYDGAILGVKSSDTVKYSRDIIIEKTIDREKIWLAQTPQVFQKSKLIKAIKEASKDKVKVTDESILMERMGYSICLIEGQTSNFKVTYNRDWKLAKFLIRDSLNSDK